MEVLHKVRPVLALAILALALGAQPALASYGKISGRITDASGEPLIGARVSTEVGGFRLGTVTDDEGRYFILNVPPGRYAVEAGHVGHQTVQKTDVLVRLDLTTTVDFSLATEAIKGPVVVVLAERPPVEKSLTSTRQTIDRSEINNTMPVSDLQDLINTTPSSFRGFIRGGRKADTKVLLDGIDVSDSYFRAGEGNGVYSPYTATHRSVGSEFTSVGVNASSVQSLDVISGTFNAEYDAATAGIVNVVSREGGGELETQVFYRTGPRHQERRARRLQRPRQVPRGARRPGERRRRRSEGQGGVLLLRRGAPSTRSGTEAACARSWNCPWAAPSPVGATSSSPAASSTTGGTSPTP